MKELTKELEDHAREIETDFLPTITDLESKLKYMLTKIPNWNEQNHYVKRKLHFKKSVETNGTNSC